MALFRFVDSVAASPTLRLDLIAGPWLVDYEGLDFSPPEFRRAVASSSLRNGDAIPQSWYGNRVLIFAVEVAAADEDLAATEMQKLHRELDRETNILQVQLGTAPVFFRTYRSPDYKWVKKDRGGSAYYRCELQLVADYAAVGLREDAQVAVSVSRDPASAGHYLDLPAIKGDLDVPAVISLSVGSTYAISTRHRGTPANLAHVIQAEAMTAGTDVTFPADATASGGTVARVSFATSTSVIPERIGMPWPSTDAARAEMAGTYRVYARVKRSGTTSDLQISPGWLGGGSVTNTSWRVTVPTTSVTSNWHLLNLGLIEFKSIEKGPTGIKWSSSKRVAMHVQRTGGSDTLDFDYFLLVPADETLTITDGTFLDGENDRMYTFTGADPWASTAYLNSTGAQGARAGAGFPLLRPGASNRLFIVHGLSPSTAGSEITGTTTVSVYYWPRYLFVRPVSS